MRQKGQLTVKNLDFRLATQTEICVELGHRLKVQRLAKRFKQQSLAARAGVSVGTVKNMESKGQSSLDSFIRIVIALDLVSDLESLFELKTQTIADLERAEKLKNQLPRRIR